MGWRHDPPHLSPAPLGLAVHGPSLSECPPMIPCSKRRRPTKPSYAAAGKKMPLDWASLDGDLLDLIGWRVLAGGLQDYVWFRAVCSHWNASTGQITLLSQLCRMLADLVRGKIEPITSIGDHTLFLGERSLCVSHSLYKGSKSFSNILPNSIICMHTLQRYPGSEGPAHFEQYDLGTGIWTAASDGGHFRKTTTKPPHTYPPYLYFLFDDV
uniref:DUF295 domain-containing protein n=1 Tax=Leersia perrieri TaxID=77586 RepID=A0A0D9XSX1_9ORYZ